MLSTLSVFLYVDLNNVAKNVVDLQHDFCVNLHDIVKTCRPTAKFLCRPLKFRPYQLHPFFLLRLSDEISKKERQADNQICCEYYHSVERHVVNFSFFVWLFLLFWCSLHYTYTQCCHSLEISPLRGNFVKKLEKFHQDRLATLSTFKIQTSVYSFALYF